MLPKGMVDFVCDGFVSVFLQLWTETELTLSAGMCFEDILNGDDATDDGRSLSRWQKVILIVVFS